MSVGKATLFQEKPGRPDHVEIPNVWKGIKFGGDTVIVNGKKVAILDFIKPEYEPAGDRKSRSPRKRVADLSDDGKITRDPKKGKSYILVNKKKVWISSWLLPKINKAENNWRLLRLMFNTLMEGASDVFTSAPLSIAQKKILEYINLKPTAPRSMGDYFEAQIPDQTPEAYIRIRLKNLEREFKNSRLRKK